VLCLLSDTLAQVPQTPNKLLILYNERSDWEANILVDRGIRSTLRQESKIPIDAYSEYIGEWEALDRRDYRVALKDLLRKKYDGKKFSCVIAITEEPLFFLKEEGNELFPGVPIVALGGQRAVENWGPSPPITGVRSKLDFKSTLDLILKLQPDVREVIVVSGNAPSDRYFADLAAQQLRSYEDRLLFTRLAGLPLSDLRLRLSSLPKHTAILFVTIAEDGTGKKFLPDEAIPALANVANAPIYGIAVTYLGKGIVGGSLLDQERLGQATAEVALRILGGERVEDISFREDSNKVMVDWRQLQRWGISEKTLPPGTIVRFYAPSLWEQYKVYVLAALGVIVAQLILICILMMEMHRRKKADLAVKDLSGRIINAGEVERKRIARELHDDIGQRLSLVCFELDAGRKANEHQEVNQNQPLQELNEIITDVHNLSHQLHSSKLENLGLERALNDVCRQLARQHGLEIRLSAEGVPLLLPEDLTLCFYRVAQEALNNSVKYSNSPLIEVKLGVHDHLIRMTIKDFGTGFNPSAAARGLGLATMRERLRSVEGDLAVVSRPGEGTEVIAKARLEPSSKRVAAA